ncbi:HtrA2 peptidase [Desulfofarcimen acetoxidans DSM 771]|uniref:HtrA2 peptidase n=1 Tax=Desulfofarcimen acetoxidans (strain ATCC 49208 / DSM 771 / KCTC 5769 / VKM B-1644 / 5575) TaxID=485916 RepID=C8W6G5_DESAS|nr:trypsin-like peptidase domain-containing protein [Desulfofarcimen acetoxidans]ACV62254.1 HtrA2 peptidase [Desulfofarcimen acetoxidans DSM 771]
MVFKNRKITLTNLLLVILIFTVIAATITAKRSSAEEDTGNTAQTISMPAVGPNTIADMVDKASSAVVKINTTVEQQVTGVNPLFSDPFFREFFGHQYQVPSRTEVQHGIGSGFIISKEGLILTNEHVIDGASKIEVLLDNDKNPLTAKLVGKDKDLDLAVLKIEPTKDLPVLKLGNSDNTRVADWVVAIGNPYGLDHTVTVGVVSAKSRPVDIEDRHYKNLLQTDASINPGNSGGPLLNLKGEVIGINTAINASAQGIGFAIPSNTVQAVLNDLETGQLKHPWLGVSVQALTQELADALGLQNTQGALVGSVSSGGPAEKAGLQRGDVIIKYNDTQIDNEQKLIDCVQKSKVGDTAVMVVVRNKNNIFLTATIEDKNSQ